MADDERTILEFYQLPTAYPSEWPAEKDLDGEEEPADEHETKPERPRSRYEALETAFGSRRSFAESQTGLGSLVQKDEPDPLGTSDSVVRSLQQFGLPVQKDARFRR